MNEHTTRVQGTDSGTPAPTLPPRRFQTRRRWWIGLTVLALVAVGTYLHYHQRQAAEQLSKVKAAAPPRGVPVVTGAARLGDIGVYINALGSVTPVYTVTVTSRVLGEIVKVYYREGQMVHNGDALLDIDPRPFQAQLTQAEGQLAHDQALLNEARIDFERYQAAYSRNAIAKQLLDDQQQLVLQDEGTVRNDQGQVENAKLQLAYSHITSPIDGRVGLRLVDPGNIVQANSATPLVVITQLQPMTVVFSVAEDYLPQIQEQLRHGHRMPVDAFDREQQKKIASGSLLTLDNVIDTSTGTIKLKAIFPNSDNALFPSQFVNARLLVTTEHGAVLIPVAAVQRNAQGAFAYVIKSDQTAAIRPLTVGTTDGSLAAVEGLQPGEIVAVNGFDKLQDGIQVAVQTKLGGATPGSGGANSGNGP